MSSLDCSKSQAFFVVQSGIVAWEQLNPIADGKWKTLSVVTKQSSVVMPLLWDVIASRPKRFRRVVRCSLVPIPPSITKSQRRRLVAEVSADPPGFSDTVAHFAATQACVTSVLSDPSAVVPDYVTAYRYCALLEFDDTKSCVTECLHHIWPTIRDLSGPGISTLLQNIACLAVLRVLELGTYAVLQLIGSSEVSDQAVQVLVARDVPRLHDIQALPQDIAKLRA
jgi:hypothetical protein